MPGREHLLTVGVLVLGLSGPARADDSCATARDGTCDELVGCALGTDTTDCEAACTAGWSPGLAGACAHLRAVALSEAAPEVATGTQGSGGPQGVWTGTL